MPEPAANVSINCNRKCDLPIIQKLQALTPYMYLKINPLAKMLLHQKLDEKLAELGIDFKQSPNVGG